MTVADRKERERQRRRNDILAAAERQFMARGYDGVSMDDIARELELSKPTLYLYFRNKESLYFTVITRSMVLMRDTFAERIAAEATGLGKTRAAAEAFFDFALRYPDHYRMVTEVRSPRFASLFGTLDVEGVKEFSGTALEVLMMLRDAVRLGTEDGTIRRRIDPEEAAVFLSMAAEGAVNITPEYAWLLDRKGVTMDEYRRHCLDIILHGIAGDSGRKAGD